MLSLGPRPTPFCPPLQPPQPRTFHTPCGPLCLTFPSSHDAFRGLRCFSVCQYLLLPVVGRRAVAVHKRALECGQRQCAGPVWEQCHECTLTQVSLLRDFLQHPQVFVAVAGILFEDVPQFICPSHCLWIVEYFLVFTLLNAVSDKSLDISAIIFYG